MTPPAEKSFLIPSLLWIAAFVCALYPVNSVQLELFMAAILLLFAWMMLTLWRDAGEGWNVPRSPVLMLAGAFWTLVLCSVFWSAVKPVSLTSACFFSVMPIGFFGGVMAGRDGYFKKLVLPLAGIYAALGLWAILQFFFLNGYFEGQARHPLADPSSLGALLSLGLFCALGWAVSDRPVKERGGATLLAVLLLGGILATVARAPIVALLPGLAVFAFFLWPRIKARVRTVLIIAVCAAGLYGAMQSGVETSLRLGDRLARTLSAESTENIDKGEGGELRLEVWRSTLAMIKDAPLLGRGIGTFFLYYPEYRSVNEIDGVYMAHNDPLQFWVELGILGPILFYGFAVAAALRSFSALKNLPEGNDRLVVASIFAALTSMVAQSHVSFNHYNLSILMMAGLLLSVWFLATGRALREPVRLVGLPEMGHNMDKALLALPFLMMGWLFLSVTGGEHLANRARDALFRKDMTSFADTINRADRVSMGLNFRTYLFAVNVPMAILESQKGRLSEAEQKKLFLQVQDYMDRVNAINPRAASAYFYMGKVQDYVAPAVLPAALNTPEEFYREALRIDPMHLGARMALFRLYQEEGKSQQELLAVLEPAYNFRYNTDQVIGYYNALAKLYLESGNMTRAKNVLERMEVFKKRSRSSLQRQNTSIPQAIMGGDEGGGHP